MKSHYKEDKRNEEREDRKVKQKFLKTGNSFHISPMMMYDEYEAFTKKYQEEYGKDTIVLYQCGSFYEVYSIDDGLINIKNVADILDVQISKRNKKDPVMNRTNCLFLGWPLVALHKFLPILMEHNYTVVLVDQVGRKGKESENENEKKTGKEVRAVTKIYSKGTFMDDIEVHKNTSLSNLSNARYMICIYIEKCYFNSISLPPAQHSLIGSNKICRFAFGISIIEVSTGVSFFKEVLPCATDDLYVSDELYRITTKFPAIELIITSSFHKDMLDTHDILDCLKLNPSCHIINRLDKMSTDLTKISRQNLILSKVFANTGMLSPIEYTNLERLHYARVSYVALMEYLFIHNECIVIKLQAPNLLDKCEEDTVSPLSSPLILSYNAVDQLDISQGLLQMLNTCQTLMGKRYFRDRLMNPTFDEKFLNSSYAMTQIFISKGMPFINAIRKELTHIYDMERLFRKVIMGKCSLNDLTHIVRSLCALKDVFRLCEDKALTSTIVIQYTEDMLSYLRPLLRGESNGESPSGDSSLSFNSGLNLEAFPTLKNHVLESESIKTRLNECVVSLNGFCDETFMNQSGQSCFFRLERNDRDGYFLVCTAKRMGLIRTKLIGYTCNGFSFDDATISTRGEGFKLSHAYFSECTEKLNHMSESIESETDNALHQIMAHISENLSHMLKPLCEEINRIDFTVNNAHIAVTKHYCCPKILIDAARKSTIRIDGKNLRHPLVEEADRNIAFVGNDVAIGPENNLLLYGLNAAGKSTLMKSVAIAVILAQAGMFVPASSFEYVPFRSLFTRITKGDDIKKHQSTFMVEMQELRSILKRANENSLVIGDELCCGTESASAVGIVAAGLCTLTQRNKSSFVFTTHLHDLTDMSCIKHLIRQDKLQIYHLHVEYNAENHILTFDRKIRKGQGLRIYGIEVCRALQIDQEFIHLANSIRNEYTKKSDDISSSSFHLYHEPKRSRYNAQQYLTSCSICGSKADEVHHIEEQHKSDKNGFINTTHKNQLSNLVGLCRSCHDKVHDGSVCIKGHVMTSEGVRLQVEEDPLEIDRAKIDDVVKNYRYVKKMSLKSIADITHLSIYKLKKILST